MKTTWKMGAGVVVLSAALALTGCSDPGAGGGGDSGPVTWPEQTADLSGQTITIWAAQSTSQTADSVIEGFEEATGATVEVETIPDPYEQGVQTRVATGDMPDLAFWQPTESSLTALNARTNLQPLDGAPWVEDYAENFADLTGSLDDTRYAALVTTPAVEGVYYNKQVLADAGITDLPTDWDSFLATARDLRGQGVTPFFEMGGDRWATQWWVHVQLADAAADGLWDRVNANEEAFTDPTIQDAITNYQDLVDEGLFNEDYATATFEDQGDALLAGDAAMAIQVNSFFSQLQAKADTAELDEKIGFFPISPSGNTGTFIPDQANAVVAFATGDDAREAAARQFLSYWMGEGYQGFVDDQQTPSLIEGVDSPAGVPEALLASADAVPDAVGSMQVLAVANPDLYINLADMLTGTKTPEQAAEATQQQFAELAAAQGVPGF